MEKLRSRSCIRASSGLEQDPGRKCIRWMEEQQLE